ncbi:MAG TPA: adenylate/guanylate cyclase domain-containing protein [Streptosporangiaceae bacterium]|nr:adenylate/guanylate cyclase domain-containing protein [Streptosporangiaceae bacterium]
MSVPPETRYARNGAIHLAYQVLGSGPPDLLVVQSGPNSHVDWNWMEPSLARFIRRLASFSRLILYDNRGVGLSDPVPGSAAPAMDEQVDDIRAILDETGCQRAVLMGNLAGCAPALVFAAAHPGRVESLILLSGYARLRAGAGYPQGLDQAAIDQIFDAILATWGSGADLDLVAPSVAADDDFRRWYAQVQRMSASPATAAAMARQWYEIDVRSVLPAIKMPTLVMARAGNVVFPVQHTRYLAEHIADAKYIELPGADLLYFAGDADQVLDAIEEFVTGARPLPSPDRFLGTVLFVDVAGSTQLAAQIGDARFRELIDGFHQLVCRQLERYQGRLVDTAGDGALALFDSPARAIACAEAVRDGVRALGLQVRAGVHTGEMEHGPGGEVRGIAVHTGARVAALAGPGEVLVSRTIRDLVAGAPIRLESRGSHELKGVPGSWEIFAVIS